MVDYIEKHAPKDKFIGYKISNIRTFQRNDYYTNESKSYGITITMGETDVNNYVKSTTGFGLYHLKFKRDSYFHNKNHWNISKRMLRNISGLLENPIESYYDNKGVFIPSKVKILDNKNQYIIGLGGYGNIYDDATILVTCF